METSTLKKYETKWFAEGREEGEQKKAEAIAKAMVADGMDIQKISKITGLSAEEIQLL